MSLPSLQSVRSPFDVRVRPLDAQQFPNLDRAFVKVSSEADQEDFDARNMTQVRKNDVLLACMLMSRRLRSNWKALS